MASLTLRGEGRVGEIAALLVREVPKCGMSCELVEEIRRSLGNGSVYVLVFEKYYMRASNRVTLTVVVSQDGSDVVVDAVSAGGQGAVFKYDWGAEDEFAAEVEQVLKGSRFK